MGTERKCHSIVVANPVSGNGRGARLLERLKAPGPALEALAEAAGEPDCREWPVITTDAEGRWRSEVETNLHAQRVKNIMVIGGDGTLTEVAKLLHKLHATGIAMISLPGGRGNDFVRGFYGYSSEQGEFWDWADARVASGSGWSRRPLDLASADGKIFLNMASVGYGGRVVENAQERKAFWSKTALVYQVEGVIAMASGGDVSVNVKVDGASVYMGPFFGAFVGNGKCNGSGLYWTREARFDDGALNANVFPKPTILEMVRTMSVLKSTSATAPRIPMRHELFAGNELVFHFDRPTPLELDGDFAGSAMSHGFKCLPKALEAWFLGSK